MKITKWIIMATLCFMLFVSQQAFANEDAAQNSKKFSPSVSLGFTLYYTWWTPMLKLKDQLGQAHITKTTATAPVFGPSLIVTLSPRWSLTANFLYGKFTVANISTHKLEADVIASYKIRPWVKYYFGLKYFGRIAPGITDNKGGLGNGFSFTIPLYKGLYLLPNISILALGSADFLTVGANGSVSLAYIFEKIHLTLALGFRAQYLRDVYAFSILNEANRSDIYFGPNFSVIYTF